LENPPVRRPTLAADPAPVARFIMRRAAVRVDGPQYSLAGNE